MTRISNIADYITETIRHLSSSIGIRPAGSPAIAEAADWISAQLQGLGYTVERQSMDCPYWVSESSCLMLGDQLLEMVPSIHSTACDLSAPLRWADCPSDLDQGHIKDAILVLGPTLSGDGFFPRNFDFFRFEEQDRLLQKVEALNPAAVIFVSSLKTSPLPLMQDSDFPIPSCTVPSPLETVLRAAAGQSARLAISSSSCQGRTANIIGRKHADRPKRAVVCAHYDTHYMTPGALDNASGTAAVLALAAILNADDLPFGIELVLFGGEDSWYPMDAAYFTDNQAYINDITLAVNIDGIGIKNYSPSVCYMAFPENQAAQIRDRLALPAGIAEVDPWPQSDHSFFAALGIPSIALSSQDAWSLLGTIVHTKEDTPDILDELIILKTVEFTRDILESHPGTD